MIRPFRFWCNKILPIVYDDSLSYYELLAKVVDYLNKVINTTNANTDYINTLGSMLTDLMKSPEIREMIEAKLDAMAEDGTLDAIINQPKMFVPNDESENEYVHNTLLEIADWLYRAKGSHCREYNDGEPTPEIRFRPYYDTNKVWQSLIQPDNIYNEPFNFTDTDSGGDQIVYMNCTGFCNMLTRGRNYLQSPYYLALGINADPDKTDAEKLAAMRNACMERGSAMQDTWTIDFLNWIHAFNMFYVMEKSGCTPRVFNKNGEWIDKVFDTMETGDILFASRMGNSYYRHIHHCMYYLKSLDDLNNLIGKPNCTYKAFDFSKIDSMPNGGEHGYIVHCTYGVLPAGNKDKYSTTADDVIRIESLEHYIVDDIERHAGKAPFIYYTSKPYSNALNSSKARRVLTGTITDGNDLMFGFRSSTVFPTYNKFVPSENKWYQGDVAITGSYVYNREEQEVVDLNTFVGVTSWASGAITSKKILHTPPGGEAGTCISYGVSGTHGAQIAICGTQNIFYRKRLSGGAWNKWRLLVGAVSQNPDDD